MTVSELQHNIDERIFCERDRRILKLRYIDGITYERIAEMVDMSDRQIKRICKKNENKIYKGLNVT